MIKSTLLQSCRFIPLYTLLLLAGCSTKVPTNVSQGPVRDVHGNTYSVRVMKDGKHWMTHNLNVSVPGSYCYDDSIENCSKYGRLYTWESARLACETLGKEWQLPTNDEWEQLVKHYGGVRTDTGQDGKEAYKRLIDGGDSGFKILFGGTRDPSGTYRRIEAHGFFWTATESDSTHAWFYNLGKRGQFVNRHNDGEKSRAISVRCIQR